MSAPGPQSPQLSSPLTNLVDRDAECAVLAALLIDGDRFEDAAQLTPADFSTTERAAIWGAIADLHAAGAEITIITVADRLGSSGVPNVSWPSVLTGLISAFPTSLSLRSHAAIVVDRAVRRRLYNEAIKQVNQAVDLARPVSAPAAAMQARARLWSADEALIPQPPIDWIVKGLIARGSLCVVYGEPGSKKTYSMIDMGVCVAQGSKWLDFETTPSRVLIVDEESGERRLKQRLNQALSGHLVTSDSHISCLCLAQLLLSEPGDVAILAETIRASQAELVIVDALADVMNGDENSKQYVQPVMNAFRRLTEETGCALVIVHHSNKFGGYRGSSAIKAAPDVMMHVISPDGGSFLHFSTDKNRDGLSCQWAARAVWVQGAEAPKQFYLEPAVLTAQQVASSAEGLVLWHLESEGESSMAEIQSALASRFTASTVKQAVFALRKAGTICRADGGKRGPGVLATYALPDHPEEPAIDDDDLSIGQLVN